MVDKRIHLSDIDKFYYLVGCCKDDALDAIKGIPVLGDKYELAWVTLKERFDKPRLVASSLVEKLLSVPKAPTENLIELNKFLVIFNEGVSALEALKIPNLGDFMIFSLASPTLSIKLFEAQVASGFPTMRELLTFVKSRVAVLKCIPRDTSSKQTTVQKFKGSPYHLKAFSKPKQSHHSSMVTTYSSPQTHFVCKCCKGAHALEKCTKFKGWSQDTRNSWAREQKICFRCLHAGHWASSCQSSLTCGCCSRKHHSLLHKEDPTNQSRVGNNPDTSQVEPQVTVSLVGQLKSQSVILGTALVHMRDGGGSLHTVRALIDSASQISAITLECSSQLGLRMSRWTAPVSGLAGATVQNVLGLVKCQIQPRFAVEPIFKFDAWVFPSITADMPRCPLLHVIADKYKHLALADPSFTQPGVVDVLLGADLFSQILNGKRVSVGESYPVAFGTVFGWTVIGSVSHKTHRVPTACPTSLTTAVEILMEKFWKLEEPDAAPEEFTQEGQCETIFRNGCRRDPSGRFCVPLLFNQSVTEETFRGSRMVPAKRFEHSEKKLMADNNCLRKLYCDFMSEYLALGHKSPATSIGSYFIPHHAVYRPSDPNPKIRVVFDASARYLSGTSLNQ